MVRMTMARFPQHDLHFYTMIRRAVAHTFISRCTRTVDRDTHLSLPAADLESNKYYQHGGDIDAPRMINRVMILT